MRLHGEPRNGPLRNEVFRLLAWPRLPRFQTETASAGDTHKFEAKIFIHIRRFSDPTFEVDVQDHKEGHSNAVLSPFTNLELESLPVRDNVPSSFPQFDH
jgi:hypothetical protein